MTSITTGDRRCFQRLTSGPFTAMKLTPLSVAHARTNRVLLQPGGPYSSTPLGARTPSLANASGWSSGHSTHSRSFCIVCA